MERLSSLLPEYDTVMQMYGCGPVLGSQLMAEIGDIRRYSSKKALVGYAGIDSPPNQSGKVDVASRSISKRGSATADTEYIKNVWGIGYRFEHDIE